MVLRNKTERFIQGATMKVWCTKCGLELVTMGAYYEENYRGNEDEYICLICRVKEKKDVD